MNPFIRSENPLTLPPITSASFDSHSTSRDRSPSNLQHPPSHIHPAPRLAPLRFEPPNGRNDHTPVLAPPSPFLPGFEQQLPPFPSVLQARPPGVPQHQQRPQAWPPRTEMPVFPVPSQIAGRRVVSDFPPKEASPFNFPAVAAEKTLLRPGMPRHSSYQSEGIHSSPSSPLHNQPLPTLPAYPYYHSANAQAQREGQVASGSGHPADIAGSISVVGKAGKAGPSDYNVARRVSVAGSGIERGPSGVQSNPQNLPPFSVLAPTPHRYPTGTLHPAQDHRSVSGPVSPMEGPAPVSSGKAPVYFARAGPAVDAEATPKANKMRGRFDEEDVDMDADPRTTKRQKVAEMHLVKSSTVPLDRDARRRSSIYSKSPPSSKRDERSGVDFDHGSRRTSAAFAYGEGSDRRASLGGQKIGIGELINHDRARDESRSAGLGRPASGATERRAVNMEVDEKQDRKRGGSDISMVSHATEYAHPTWSAIMANASPANTTPIPTARPSTATSSRSNLSISASSSTAIRLALQEKYTPEQVFYMYKEYEFTGRIVSVGLHGPDKDTFEAESIANTVADARTKKAKEKAKVGKQDIWTDEAEFAFLAAELYIPATTASKVMFMQKPCGRNEIIALIITMAMGKYMTRKQVSSHLQVVRQRKKMHNEVKVLFDQESGENGNGSSPSKGSCGTGRLDTIHPRLYKIIGVPTSCNLSDMPKPKWIADQESGKPADAPGSSMQQPRAVHLRIPGSSGAQSRKIGSGGYYTEDELSDGERGQRNDASTQRGKYYSQTAYRGGISNSSGSRMTSQTESSESESDFFAQPVNGIGKPIQDDSSDSESESDSDSERVTVWDVEKVSETTPHSASKSDSGWTHLQDRLAVSAYHDFQLSKIGIGLVAGSAVATKSITNGMHNLPITSPRGIPAMQMRYPHIEKQLRRQTASPTVLHITLGIDLNEISNFSSHDLTVDLRIQARPMEGIPTSKAVDLVTTCGYLTTTEDDAHRPDIAPLCEVDAVDASGNTLLAPTTPFVDRYLSKLANTDKKADSTILPYYWIMQQISTHRSTLILVYSLKAATDFSIEVERLVL